MTAALQSLHATYCSMTGRHVTYRIHESVFADFIKKGFTEHDLRIVLAHLLSENRRMRGARYSLALDKLLDWEYRHFDSLLSEAKAKYRNHRKPTPRDKALAAYMKPVDPELAPQPLMARSVKDVLRKVLE